MNLKTHFSKTVLGRGAAKASDQGDLLLRADSRA